MMVWQSDNLTYIEKGKEERGTDEGIYLIVELLIIGEKLEILHISNPSVAFLCLSKDDAETCQKPVGGSLE